MFLQPEITWWLARIEAEYREMPGLQLTRHQMTRMWNLDEGTCGVLLHLLVARGILRQTSRRAYVLAAASEFTQLGSPLDEMNRGES